jgi:hypothetical protein
MAADAKYKIELQAISGLDQKQFVTGAAIAMDPEGDVHWLRPDWRRR